MVRKKYNMPDFGKGPERRARGIIFLVDMSDIEKERRLFNNLLGNNLKEELRETAKKISSEVSKRLSANYDPSGSSKRINSILVAIGKGSAKSNQREASLYVGNISNLDRSSKISRLDKISPEYHTTPFLSRKVKKKSGQTSKELYSLWRILDRREVSISPFGPTSHEYMRFTSARNNYSGWIFAKIVRKWSLGSVAQSKRYWFLSEQRDIYDTDKKMISSGVSRGVGNIISKTRFRFDTSRHANI